MFLIVLILILSHCKMLVNLDDPLVPVPAVNGTNHAHLPNNQDHDHPQSITQTTTPNSNSNPITITNNIKESPSKRNLNLSLSIPPPDSADTATLLPALPPVVNGTGYSDELLIQLDDPVPVTITTTQKINIANTNSHILKQSSPIAPPPPLGAKGIGTGSPRHIIGNSTSANSIKNYSKQGQSQGPDALTEDEERATKQFLEHINSLRLKRGISPLSWNAGVKFLMARKFNVRRAWDLYEQHHAVRIQSKLISLDPTTEPLRSELLSGKFTVLPSRDLGGAAIAVFTARLHQPSAVPHEHTLQGLVYQLDAALEDRETQRSGLVFIYDMSDSKYSHFDYDLSIKILTLLKGGYPARLKKVLIVTAPLWFRAPFRILRLFVREKLRDRVFTVSIPQLGHHIPHSSLPRSLGGQLEVNHHQWLNRCTQTLNSTDLWGISPYEQLTDMASGNAGENSRSSSGPRSGDNIRAQSSSISIRHLNALSKQLEEDGNSTPSPVQNSSGSSGFSDDDNIPFEERTGLTLTEFIQHVKQKGRSGLYDEYSEIISRNPEGTFNASKQRGNISRNRYSDVLCYDHTRVILSITPGTEETDYINANFVDGYKQKHAFISTQGPLPRTFLDFWKMVWEQRVVTIVMTTRAVERGRTKCGQYWPPDTSSSVTHEQYKIVNLGVETYPDYAVSRLSVTNTRTNETRNLSHLLFLSWPDYGVPSSAAQMLNFLQIMRQEQAREVSNLGNRWEGHALGPPIIVHCSAGIGRTGTLCTLDICIRRFEDQGTIDVQGTVERIRSQRAYSIQVPEQYLFCHAAMIEYAKSKGLLEDSDLEGVPDLLEEPGSSGAQQREH